MNNNEKRDNKHNSNERKDNKLKVQITLNLTYDCPPSRSNKIDIQKLLALELFRLGDEENNKLSFSDVEVISYDYKINTNPNKQWKNNSKKGENTK